MNAQRSEELQGEVMKRLYISPVGIFLLVSVFSVCPVVYAVFRPPHHIVIQPDTEYPTYVHAADVDGDGDLDVLSASFSDNKIAWYQNDGNGAFGDQQVISTSAFLARSVYAADLDCDGDLDVLSASTGDDKIAWYENDGFGGFGVQQVITTSANGAYSVYVADLDGDGDLDVLSASWNDDTIAWYENE